MVMKAAPLTDNELEFIRWTIWEPLKRNWEYQKDYKDLQDVTMVPVKVGKKHAIHDQSKALEFAKTLQKNAPKTPTEIFCEKWGLLSPTPPEVEFDTLIRPVGFRLNFLGFPPEPLLEGFKALGKKEIKKRTYEAKKKVEGLFMERYEPRFDHAAFVIWFPFIVNDKYLKVWIDLEASKKQIEKAVKKELDEWHRDKWRNFYQGKRRRKPKDNAVFVTGISQGKYLELNINLEAPRSTRTQRTKGYVDPELELVLKEHLSGRKRPKQPDKFFLETWKSRFEIYDMVEKFKRAKKRVPFEDLARTLNIDLSTIYKQYNEAKEKIKSFGEGETTAADLKNFLKNSCEPCPEQKPCTKLCKEYNKIVNSFLGYVEKTWNHQQGDKINKIAKAVVYKDWRAREDLEKHRLMLDDEIE